MKQQLQNKICKYKDGGQLQGMRILLVISGDGGLSREADQTDYEGVLVELLPLHANSSPCHSPHLAWLLSSMEMGFYSLNASCPESSFLSLWTSFLYRRCSQSSIKEQNFFKHVTSMADVFRLMSCGNVFRVNCFEVTLCQAGLNSFRRTLPKISDSLGMGRIIH